VNTVAALARSIAITNRTVFLGMSVLMVIPTALVSVGFKPFPAAVLLTGCLGVIALIARDPSMRPDGVLQQRVNPLLLGACICIAAALLFYSGSLHFFPPTFDWRIRDAVLADLSAAGFPATYRVGVEEYLLRAPIGMYVMPAMLGFSSGLFSAHIALWIQNSFALGVILYFICALGFGLRHAALLLLSGTCAILPVALLWFLGALPPFNGLLVYGLDAWHPTYQYSSAMIQFFWVPNHAIPGWWIAVAFLLHFEEELDGASVAATTSAALFWSPLVVFAVPFLLLGRLREHVVRPRMWISALIACCFAPVVIYFTADASSIPLSTAPATAETFSLYSLFVLALAPHAAFLFLSRESLPKQYRMAAVISLILLFTLPAFIFGTSNDIVMRGSIVPLTILWFLFGYVLLGSSIQHVRDRWLGMVTGVLCSLSAVGTLAMHHLAPGWPISDCSIVQSARELGAGELSPHYHARWSVIPDWLMIRGSSELRPTAPRECWSLNEELYQTGIFGGIRAAEAQLPG
jgi:hypothetical protein